MGSLCRFIAIAGALLLCGCATTGEPVTDYDTSYDFQALRSIAIKPFERVSDAELLVSDMQAQRVNDSLAQMLQGKGYAVVPVTEQPDMLLTWHLVSREKTAIRSYNAMAFYNCWRCGPSSSEVTVDQFTQGTFIVDMVDPSLGRSVWRGVLQSALDPEPRPDDTSLKRVAETICREFPPSVDR